MVSSQNYRQAPFHLEVFTCHLPLTPPPPPLLPPLPHPNPPVPLLFPTPPQPPHSPPYHFVSIFFTNLILNSYSFAEFMKVGFEVCQNEWPPSVRVTPTRPLEI